jgi:hypothetical protein
MKKIILCLLACTLIFTSCNDDDNDDTSTNQANILGNWQLSSETSNGEATTLTDCELQDFLLFESNGNLTNTYKYGDNCEITETTILTYSISGNNMTLNFEDESNTAEITTLNATSLTLKFVEEESEGTDIGTLTFTKQ